MSHLTEEQFEDVIQGLEPEPKHLAGCDYCRGLLDEKTAIAGRLRSAFNSVKTDKQLANNIRAQFANKAAPKRIELVEWLTNIRLRTIAWPAAAALLITAAILSFNIINLSPATAAQAELVEIHNHNLTDNHEFHSQSDPEKLAEYFKDKLGFTPSMPIASQGMQIRGCCVRHFRGRIVGSYVVDTPQGVMSVIVVTDKPRSLGMAEKFEHQSRVYWKSSFDKCDMVTVRLGDYSYCAVGEVSHEYLTELLSRLMPQTQE